MTGSPRTVRPTAATAKLKKPVRFTIFMFFTRIGSLNKTNLVPSQNTKSNQKNKTTTFHHE
jgi:hypothetical protein